MYKEGATIDVTLDDWEIMHTLRSPPLVNHPGEPSLEENLWDYKHNNRPPDEMR